MPDIRFGEIDFSSDGAYVWGEGQYSAPARSVDFIEVPGRNGDLLIDNGNYTNTTAVFDVIITKDVEENTNRLKYLLYSQKGYQKLYDSDLKGFYRMASFNSGFEILSTEGGTVRIEFDCKPFRYDISGDEAITLEYEEGVVSSGFYLENPYFEDALPEITVYADMLSESGAQILIDNADGTSTTIDISGSKSNWTHGIIDSEKQYFYRVSADRTENLNKYISTADVRLKSGENRISFTEGIEKLEIVPRWVTL